MTKFSTGWRQGCQLERKRSIKHAITEGLVFTGLLILIYWLVVSLVI
jgi:hypothetical protein